ncbi:MAG: type II toxin-antitoxin system RelB/DinJ family antitoxin [Clostridia bacterium]|nr:type II toxin-antitoxin system RelB/DinJ family antitoxin [Clostridia bacterium]
MARTANINVRVEPHVKEQAEALFANFGITVSDAINMFLHQALLENALPIRPSLPQYNEETLAAMQEARDIAAGKIKAKAYHSVDALMEDLLDDADD